MKWRAPSISAIWLWLAFFLPAAAVYHPRAGWNVNTRLDLVFALVDHGTFQIDLYHDIEPFETGDKAFFDGHYYSDKVFGLPLISAPFHAALKMFAAVIGKEPSYHLAHWWVRCFGVSAFAGFLCVWLCGLLRGFGLGARPALALTAFLFFGTLLFPYSTVYYPLIPGCFLCLWAWRRIEAANPQAADSCAPRSARAAFFSALLTGLALGGAMLMDYIFGLVVAWLGIRALWNEYQSPARGGAAQNAQSNSENQNRQPSRFAVRAAGLALGGMIPLALFAIYCRSIFGSFSIPYKYEADALFREGMSRGFMGVQRFQPAVLYYLTVHPYRGIFFYSPILAAALAGAPRMIFGPAHISAAAPDFNVRAWRWAGVSAIALGAAYLLFNASYYMWWGGWAMGPRLLIPAIPFMGLGLAGLWTWGRSGRAAAVAAGAWSVLATLGPALVDPQTPMWLHKTPELLTPSISQNLAAEQFLQMVLFSRGDTAPMLGHALGLGGLWALIPAAALFAVPAMLWIRKAKA